MPPMQTPDTSQTPTIDALAILLKAAADPLRLQVLQVLGSNSFAASELSALLNLGQSRLSHHLKLLAQAGLVEAKREGNTLFYRRALPNWGNPTAFAHAHQAVFDAVDSTQHEPEIQAALLKIEHNRSVLSHAYFEEQGHISQDPFLAYSQDYHELAADILQRALPNNAHSALEIGPGEGHFLQHIAPLFTHLTGIDRSQKMLQTAQDRLDKHKITAELVLGNWPHNAPAQQFDAVILNMVLHHLAHPAESFIAAARRLKPQGLLLITELCEHQQQWTTEQCGHIWLGFAEEDLQRWAEQAGLAPQEVQFLALRNGFQLQVRSFRHATPIAP